MVCAATLQTPLLPVRHNTDDETGRCYSLTGGEHRRRHRFAARASTTYGRQMVTSAHMCGHLRFRLLMLKLPTINQA